MERNKTSCTMSFLPVLIRLANSNASSYVWESQTAATVSQSSAFCTWCSSSCYRRGDSTYVFLEEGEESMWCVCTAQKKCVEFLFKRWDWEIKRILNHQWVFMLILSHWFSSCKTPQHVLATLLCLFYVWHFCHLPYCETLCDIWSTKLLHKFYFLSFLW